MVDIGFNVCKNAARDFLVGVLRAYMLPAVARQNHPRDRVLPVHIAAIERHKAPPLLQNMMRRFEQLARRVVGQVMDQTARDDDVETLVTMEIYSEALVSESRALVSAAVDGRLPLAAEQISSLRTIEMDAQKSIDALERVNIDYAKSYPLQFEDNAEAWMPILTGALLY